MKTNQLMLTLLLTLLSSVNAQSQNHVNLWTRITANITLSKKINTDIEFQHRRQNGWDNMNPTDKNLMYTCRGWVHYQHNESVKFSLSPFAQFRHYKIINNAVDANSSILKEIRMSAAVDLNHEIRSKISIQERTAIEYRIFDSGIPNIIRFRSKFGIGFQLNSKTNFLVYDELLLNLHGTSKENFLDHDRIGVQVGYKASQSFKIEGGYIFISRHNTQLIHPIHENNIMVNLTLAIKPANKKHTTNA